MKRKPRPSLSHMKVLRRIQNHCGKEIVIDGETFYCDKDLNHENDCGYNDGWGWSPDGKRN